MPNNRKPTAGRRHFKQVITHRKNDKGDMVINTTPVHVIAKLNKAGEIITTEFIYNKPVTQTIIHARY